MAKRKKENQDETRPPSLLLRGEVVDDTTYNYQVIEEFRNNPLIEALPDILSPEEVAQRLEFFPDYKPEYREFPMHYRLLLLENAREFFIPLSRDIELYYTIINMIRRSYIHRNPVLTAYYSKINERIAGLNEGLHKSMRPSSLRSRARGATIVGTGGNGKSSSVENSLLLLPQVINHKSYQGKDLILKQLVWLKIDCPQDGSPRGLCLAFFAAVDEVLGTSYFARYVSKRNTINELLLFMARVAAIHCLGVLVMDEIQDLSQAKSGGEAHLLNFFVHLENSIGVPFILIGTPKALPLFKGEFRQARRASEQGDFLWKRMEMLSESDRSEPDPAWNQFVRQMWKYQYIKNVKLLPKNILDEPVTKILYNESQGIIAVALTIFLLTQKRAIMSHVEKITPDVMISAIRDNQNLISSMIDSIKLGRKVSVHGEADFEPSVFRQKNSLAADESPIESDTSVSGTEVSRSNRSSKEPPNKRDKKGARTIKGGTIPKPDSGTDFSELLCLTDISLFVKSPTELL
jgi:hypothetical protein